VQFIIAFSPAEVPMSHPPLTHPKHFYKHFVAIRSSFP